MWTVFYYSVGGDDYGGEGQEDDVDDFEQEVERIADRKRCHCICNYCVGRSRCSRSRNSA